MPKETYTLLEPDFYQAFYCVASDCRSNCCRDSWNISMDKASYKRLRNLKSPSWLVEDFSKYFRKQQNTLLPNQYAVIVNGLQGCALQTPEGLCRIHAELGPEQLCPVCRDYPRSRMIIRQAQTMECTVSHSCEEVVRLLLERQEPILFSTPGEIALNTHDPATFSSHYSSILLEESPRMEHYHGVRTVAIAVLQAREFSIKQRMMLLAILMDKLGQLEQEEQWSSFPAALEQFVQAVEEGLYQPILEKEFQLDSTKGFVNYAWIYAFKTSPAEDRWMASSSRGLETDYQKRLQLYEQFMDSRQHLLENILVNELFMRNIPFLKGFTIWQSFCYLAAFYSAWTFMLGACLADQGPLEDTPLIDFAAYFCKRLSHSLVAKKDLTDFFEKNQLTTLASILAVLQG